MLNKKDKISLLIPAHNEELVVVKTIEQCYQQMDQLGIDFEIIAINDGSTDGTKGELDKVDKAKIITNPYNLGYGASLKRGIKASTGNWIFIIDADGTYPIDKIESIVKFAGEYDMVVGNRRHDSDHFGRKPAKWFLKKLASFLAGKKIPDLNSGMRIFRKDIAPEFFHLFPSGFSFTSTITLACFASDYTVKYVDIPYYKRVGASGIKPRHFFNFVSLIIKLFVYFKPLRMLSPIAWVLLALGMLKGVKDIWLDGTIGILAAILIIFAIQVFVIALIGEVVIKRK